MQQTENSAFRQLRVEVALAYLDRVKLTFTDQPAVYESFLAVMKDFKAQTINTSEVIERVSDLFRDHPELIYGFNAFLPADYKIELGYEDERNTKDDAEEDDEEVEMSEAAMMDERLDRAILFYANLKKHLQDPSELEKISELLMAFQADTRRHRLAFLCERIAFILEDYPQLRHQFELLLPHEVEVGDESILAKPRRYKVGIIKRATRSATEEHYSFQSFDRGFRDDPHKKFKPNINLAVATFFERLKEHGDSKSTNQIMAVFSLFGAEMLQREEVIVQLSTIADEDLMDEIKNLLYFKDVTCADIRDYLVSQGELVKYQTEKPSKSSKWGPSYRRIRRQVVKGSGQTSLCDSVLNDEFVSVPVGTEDSGTFFKRSQYEEVLFQCEDDRSELDWIIEQNMKAMQALELAAEKLQLCHNLEEQRQCRWDLKGCHISAINRIYAEKAPDVLEGFRKNPLTAVNIVLLRLRQKDAEWQAARRELNMFWKEVYEKGEEKFWETNVGLFKTSEKRTRMFKGFAHEAEAQHNGKFIPSQHVFEDPPLSLFSQAPAADSDAESDRGDRPIGVGVQSSSSAINVATSSSHLQCVHGFSSQPSSCRIHCDIFDLMSTMTRKHYAQDEPALLRLWTHFVFPFFGAASSSKVCGEDGFVVSEWDRIHEPCFLGNTVTVYANHELYLFLRVYQVLHNRLSRAKRIARCRKRESLSFRLTGADETSKPPDMWFDGVADNSSYHAFLRSVKKLVQNELDGAAFEDRIRTAFGHGGFFLCSAEQLLRMLIDQALTCLKSEKASKLLQYFSLERKKSARFKDNNYFEQSRLLLREEKLMFHIAYSVLPEKDQRKGREGRLDIVTIDNQQLQANASSSSSSSSAVENNVGAPLGDLQSPKLSILVSRVVLKRNIRSVLKVRLKHCGLLQECAALNANAPCPSSTVDPLAKGPAVSCGVCLIDNTMVCDASSTSGAGCGGGGATLWQTSYFHRRRLRRNVATDIQRKETKRVAQPQQSLSRIFDSKIS